MPYAILRLEKRKGQQTAAINKHHERTKETYGSNPDIDHTKTKLNYHLIEPIRFYRQEVEERIKAAGCKVRKDSVKFIDVLIGATPEFINVLSEEDVHEYFRRALDFMKEEVGEENIFSAVVHRDERTQHMHICFTPITMDKRLSARDFMGSRARLIEWQDKFHAYMSERWPELDRGAPAAETNRRHLPIQLFKQATRIDEQIKGITGMLSDVTVFNAGKKREELAAALSNLLPAADHFKRQVETTREAMGSLKMRNTVLGEDLSEAQENNAKLFQTVKELERRNDEVERLLDRIPEDILEAARERKPRNRAR